MSKIIFVGDILIADSYYDVGFGMIEKIKKDGTANFLEPLSSCFDSADLTIANLEFVISDQTYRKGLRSKEFLMTTKVSDILSKIGIDIFSLANNHIMQHEALGFESTVKAMYDNRIKTIGTVQQPYKVIELEDVKVGLISASTIFDPFVDDPNKYYINLYPSFKIEKGKLEDICKCISQEDVKLLKHVYQDKGTHYDLNLQIVRSCLEIEMQLYTIFLQTEVCKIMYPFMECFFELRDKCDYLITYLHWGDEFVNYPAQWQVDFAHRLVDLGANFVVGCHSHCLQGVERYKNACIAYSLGNFLFNTIDPALSESALLEISIEKSVEGSFYTKYEMIPYYFNSKKMLPEQSDRKIEDKILSYSKSIGEKNNKDYIQAVAEGLKKSRVYKKKHLIKNVYKISPKILSIMLVEFLRRRIVSVLNKNVKEKV